MTSRQHILLGISITLAVLLIVAAGSVWYLLKKSLPATEGRISVQGLGGAVDIYRDPSGIPHILASNEADAYFAAGFVHAQDRLWQMDLARRYGQGRLAEILGSRALPADLLMRTIGIGRIADSLLRTISPQSRAVFEAYARGVNACIAENARALPVEFDLLQYVPEPWTARDCLIVTRLMGWELALSWWVDLTLGDLIQTLGEEKARQVFPWYPDDAPVILSAENRYGTEGTRGFQQAFLAARALLRQNGSAIGSNCWAVTRSRSATGLPVLANDPHLLFMQPARWYAMHLSCPTMNVAGFSLPGTPGIVIGHNDHIAWGMTAIMADDVDFSIERINLADSLYEYKGAMRRLSVEIDSIFVKDSSVVTMTRYSTHHGPLIDRVHPATLRQQTRWPSTGVAMRWTGADPSDEGLAIYRLNHARSWADFTQALEPFGLPGQNVTYADREGNIGYQAAARIPIRTEQRATLPVNGWDGEAEWRGYVPYAEMPRMYNPTGDLVATANNKLSRSYPYHISNLWESDSRITRILDMLAEQPTHRAEDFRYMQMDVHSNYAGPIRDAIVSALLRMPERSVELTRVMNLLSQWNLRMPASSVPAAIFNATFVRLLRETFADEMGSDLYARYVTLSNIPIRVLPRLLSDTATTWFDDVRTPTIETKDDILRKSVMLALLDLSRRCGPDMDSWEWGTVHTLTFRHPLGEVKPFDRLFNVGPLKLGGNVTTVNNGEYSLTRPFDANVGASMRMIVDLASPDTCRIVLPTGQSGQPLSPHYADQCVLWQTGGYVQLVSSPSSIRASSWEHLVLSP
jgi:penicillin G amidase